MTKIVRKVLPPRSSRDRGPKRSTLEALHRLNGWLSTEMSEPEDEQDPAHPDKVVENPWHQPEGTHIVRSVREVQRYMGGWAVLTLDIADDLKDWKATKTLYPLLSQDRTHLKGVKLGKARVWVGQCCLCKKSTLGISTYFLQGGCCLHCGSLRNASVDGPGTAKSGYAKFFAGTYPLAKTIHILYAKDRAQAQEIARTKGYAWVTSSYAPAGGKTIILPLDDSKPLRPPEAWAFEVNDYPPNWQRASEAWQGFSGESLAWFTPPPQNLEAPPLQASELVDFNDFM
jgi:hypothetical protein